MARGGRPVSIQTARGLLHERNEMSETSEILESSQWVESNPWIERTRAALRDADRFVHTSPWTALGVVAVLGMVAGLILAQRDGT